MKLGIVIVSYRTDDLTVRYVREELSKIRTECRIVVVANGASPAEAEALAERLPGVDVLPAENKGYACGNNLGARFLRDNYQPAYLLFTNNDIRFVSEHLIERLLSCLEARPEAAFIGPEVLGLDGRRQGPEPYLGLWDRYVWMYLSTPFLSKEAKRRRFALDYPAEAQEGLHYKLTGAFLLGKAEEFFEIGGFDEGTFLYAEENILSDRLKAIGKGLYFLPSVTIVHEHEKTTEKVFRKRQRSLMQFGSMAYYYRTCRGYSRISCAIVSLIYRLILLFRR